MLTRRIGARNRARAPRGHSGRFRGQISIFDV